jgi:DNA polymerase-3 subunit delta
LTFEQINKSVKNKKFSPLYLLHGEEAFFIDLLVDAIEKEALSETEKEFNQNIFYGKDTEAKRVIGACMQYPMMADYRLIIVKEAQNMKEIENLMPIIENPVPSTILVVVHKEKKLSQKSKLTKGFATNGVVFESNRLYENKIPDWIKSHSRTLGINISDNAADLMTTLLSNDLTKLDNELQKLKISFDGTKTIDVDQIRENISLNREFTIFELSNAIGEANLARAMKILDIFNYNPGPYPNILIISTLFGFFSKVLICSENIKKTDVEIAKIAGLNSYFVKDYRKAAINYNRPKLIEIISLLKEYDLKSKGVESRNISQIELIREMILKIMN